jgi:dihydroneopterin aldolase
MDRRRDRIFVSRIECVAHVGVGDEERRLPQQLWVDVEVWTDVRRPASTDAIEDSVDYGQIVARTVEIGSQREYRLLEALAERIARAVLELGGEAVRVLVRKPKPPIPTPLEYVSVEVFRERQDAAK